MRPSSSTSELVVVAGARTKKSTVARVQRVDRVVEAVGRRSRRGAVLARNRGELQLKELLRPERPRHAKDVSGDRVRGRAQGDLGRAPDAVPADALEDETALARATRRRERGKTQVAVGADGEHVAERGLELELDDDVDGMRVRVEDADALAQSIREKTRAADRERVGRMPRRSEDGSF